MEGPARGRKKAALKKTRKQVAAQDSTTKTAARPVASGASRNPTKWICRGGCGEIAEVYPGSELKSPEYRCDKCGKCEWDPIEVEEELDPRQLELRELLVQIGVYLGALKIPASRPGAQVSREMPIYLERSLYDELRESSEALKKLASSPYPGDLLEPGLLGSPKGAAVVPILDSGRRLLRVIKVILEDPDLGVRFAALRIDSFILSSTGKNCITSAGADMMRFFRDHIKPKK